MKKLGLGVALSFVAIACSSSDSTASAGGPGAQAYAQAICAHTQKCFPNDFTVQYGDTNGCVTLFEQEAAFGLSLPGISATDSQLKACADAYGTLDCGGSEQSLTACQVAGTLAAGTACESDSQCQSSYCKVDVSSTTGSSAAVECGQCAPKADVGGACSDDEGCNTGLVCDTGGTCSQPLAKGAACTLTGKRCDATSKCVNGTCGEPLAAGAKCDDTADECVDGTACQNGACTSFDANVTIVDVGQPCSLDGTGGKQIACKRGSCVGATGAEKCVANAQVGQACATSITSTAQGTTQDLPDCDGFAVCENGTCVKPDPNECK